MLKDPKKYLEILCNKLKIQFYKQMLCWPKGSRDSDGIWGKYWYKNVNNSTSFHSHVDIEKKIHDKYYSIYIECLNLYEELYEHRIR